MSNAEIADLARHFAIMLSEGKGEKSGSGSTFTVTLTSLEPELMEMLVFDYSWISSPERLVESRVVKIFGVEPNDSKKLVFHARWEDKQEGREGALQVIKEMPSDVRERMERLSRNPTEVVSRVVRVLSEKELEEHERKVTEAGGTVYL